jgi:hypothetical protein
MPDLGPLVEALFPLVRTALGIALRTTIGMVALGLALAGGAFWLAAEGSWLRGLLAALLAFVLCAVLGGVLAIKRAVLGALAAGSRRSRVGERTVGLLFDRMAEHVGFVERLPLAQAEQALRRAIQGLLAAEGGNWLQRRLRASLLEKVEAITLARLRAEGGGVDLQRVRADLCATVDARLLETLRGAVSRLTLLLVLAAGVGAVLVALAIRRLPI